MRIRKNNKNLFSGGELREPHHCLLNRSPWDAIPFNSEADPLSVYPSSFAFDPQLLGHESFNDENRSSFVDAEGGFTKSPASMAINYSGDEKQPRNQDPRQKGLMSEQVVLRRGQTRAVKKILAAGSRSYDFSYYSGFGPRWSKRRRDGEGDAMSIVKRTHEEDHLLVGNKRTYIRKKRRNGKSPKYNVSSFLSRISEEMEGGPDYMDGEDNNETSNENCADKSTRKRWRKLVKERSLNSLMLEEKV